MPATPSSAPDKSSLLINVYDGTRQPLADGTDVLYRIIDGNQKQLFVQDENFSSLSLKVPFYDNFGDNYNVIVFSDGYKQAGFTPVKLAPSIPTSLDLMLIPKDGHPNFAMAHAFLGVTLCYAGRWQDGDAAARRALRLSPRDPLAAIYCGVAAYAQFIGHNYEEAVQMARESMRQRGDFVGAHRVLTAAAGMAGQNEIASMALRELRRAQPNVTLAWIANELPMQQPADREHYLEGFRRAGLE